YEHLIHVPVALDMLKPADAPVAAAPLPVVAPRPQPVAQPMTEPPALRPAAPVPTPPEPPALKPAASVRMPEPPTFRPAALIPMPEPPLAAAAVDEPLEPPSVGSSERGLDDLMAALRSREFSLIDAAMVTEAAWQIVDQFGEALKEIRPTEAFAIGRDVVAAVLVAPVAVIRGTGALRSGIHAPSLPRPQLGGVAPPIANQVPTVVAQTLSGTSSPPLAKPAFDVPPLSAYRAALDAQGPAPKAKPNEMVEWVVALRNTGSAGWYRGLEGAQ